MQTRLEPPTEVQIWTASIPACVMLLHAPVYLFNQDFYATMMLSSDIRLAKSPKRHIPTYSADSVLSP